MTCRITEPEEIKLKSGVLVRYRNEPYIINCKNEGNSFNITNILTGETFKSIDGVDLYVLPIGTKIEITI